MDFRTSAPVMDGFFEDIGHGFMEVVRGARDITTDVIGAVKGGSAGAAGGQVVYAPAAPAAGNTGGIMILGIGAAVLAAVMINK